MNEFREGFIVTDGRRNFVREVHWVQGKDGVIREAFIKVHHRGE